MIWVVKQRTWLKRNHGFSLIEILIAVFILTFGLLSIAGLYINTLKNIKNSYWSVLATSQLSSMIEQQKSFDRDCSNWSIECTELLPHGTCKCDFDKITVCWKGKYKKQCLHN
jgi:prepilin-type N-terminal cleavage/methylation domain-containing protein